MKSSQNNRSTFSWTGLFMILLRLAVLMVLAYLTIPLEGLWPALIGLSVFGVLLWVYLILFPGASNKGMRLLSKGKAEEAVAYYAHLHKYYSRHRKLDLYRHYILFNTSTLSFREIALINTGFCYISISDFENALLYYSRALEEFPQSFPAKENITMIEAIRRFNGQNEENYK